MAAIDTISGITLVSGTDREYEISSDVAIGSNIDDPPPFSIFKVISGGRYRFVAGCDTTFDRCNFIERDASTVYPQDNFQGTNCRFSGGATCAPVFKGCRFVQEDGLARSDWDIAEDGAAPTFETADDGSKCVITIYDSASADQFNHFASENITIDGLIVDSQRGGGNMEVIIPPTISGLEVVDNDPGSGSRHFVVLVRDWSAGSTYYISGLNVRNVACEDGPNTGETIVLRDPIGNTVRPVDDFASQRGIMQVERTYSVASQDALTLANINPTIVITATSDDDVRYDEALVSGAFSNFLFQYEYRYNQFANDPDTRYDDDEYRRALVLWGYDPKVKTFTLDYDAASPSGTNDGTLFFFAKTGVTEALQSTVDAYTALETTSKLFDALHRYEIVRTDRENVGATLVEGGGTVMDMQANNLVITNAVIGGYPLVLAGTTFTCYTEGSAFTLGAFDTIATTGTVTFTQANTLPDSITIDGDAVISEVTDADAFSVTGTLDLETAGTYNWNSMASNSVNELTNSSGGSITIVTDNAAFVTTNTGPNITISAPVVNTGLDFSGLVAGSQIVVCDTGTQTERFRDNSSGTTETWSETYVSDGTVDYTIRLAGYLDIRVTGVAIGNTVVPISVNQTIDPIYNASHGITIATDYNYNAATRVMTIVANQEGRDLYSALIDDFISESAYVNCPFPLKAVGPDRIDFLAVGYYNTATTVGATIDSGDIQFWKGAGMQWEHDTTGNPTKKFYSIKSSNTLVASSIVGYTQVNTGTPIAATLVSNQVNQVIQFFEDTNGDGTPDYNYTGHLIFKAFLTGYYQARWDVINNGGVTTLEPYEYNISLIQDAIAGTTGDQSITITTLTDHTSSPISVGGKSFDYEPVDPGTSTAEDLLAQHNYNVYNAVNTLISGSLYTSYQAFDLPDLIIEAGANYETERGYFEGDGAVTDLSGVYVSRSAVDHPGMARFQSNDGTYYTPADTVIWAAANILDGSRVRLYNVTQATEIDNSVVSGGGGYSYTLVPVTDFDSGDQITMLATYQNGGTAKQVFRFSTTVTTADVTINDAQVDWDNPGPNTLAIDGDTVSECTTDYVGVQVEVIDADNTTQKSRLAAFIVDALTTADGVRNWVGLDGSAVITYSTNAAAQIDASVAAVEIYNAKASSTLSVKDSFEFDWSDGVDRIDAVSGSSVIWLAPDRVLVQAIGSGVTSQDKTDIVDGVHSKVIENAETFSETIRIIRSATAGESTAPVGGGAGQYTFRDAADSKARITATVDANGQRTSVTTDGT